MLASVVDFPQPVGPVTSTSPDAQRVSSATEGGAGNSSSVRIRAGMIRNAAPTPATSMKTLTRARTRSGVTYSMLTSPGAPAGDVPHV